MKLLLLLFILICIIIIYRSCREYFIFKENYTEINFLPRKLVGNASCMKDDIELSDSTFTCKMNEKYSPVNTNVTTIKYQNFSPFISKDEPVSSSSPIQNIQFAPTISFLLLNTLTPSLANQPIFSDDDFKLIGINKNPVTADISLNDYKKLMKIINYGNHNLYDKLIDNYKTGIQKFIKNVNLKLEYAIDQYWCKLQCIDNWYLLTPLTVSQKPDYSDIEKQKINYNVVMLDLDKTKLKEYQKKQQELINSRPKLQI